MDAEISFVVEREYTKNNCLKISSYSKSSARSTSLLRNLGRERATANCNLAKTEGLSSGTLAIACTDLIAQLGTVALKEHHKSIFKTTLGRRA